MGSPKKGSVVVLVGTRKGLFIFHSDARRKLWAVDGPHFLGHVVHNCVLDPRDRASVFATTYTEWWGADVRRTRNWGRTWQKTKGGVRYEPASGLSVKCVWSIQPGRASEPGVVYAGVDPAGLFRSEDGGVTWAEVKGLNRHATRKRWAPGAGGLIVHSILVDAHQPRRLYVGISAAGTFRTDDGGRAWKPCNKNVRADFMPNKFPAVGQCVHRLALGGAPNLLYQQNHCGVYRSDNAGDDWVDISRGLPSRFGFPIAVHARDPRTIWVVPLKSAQYRFNPGGVLAAFRSTNAGRSWQKQGKGLPSRNAYLTILRQAMSVDTCESVGVYFGTESGQIFYSRNEGREWHLMADSLPPVLSVSAAVV